MYWRGVYARRDAVQGGLVKKRPRAWGWGKIQTIRFRSTNELPPGKTGVKLLLTTIQVKE